MYKSRKEKGSQEQRDRERTTSKNDRKIQEEGGETKKRNKKRQKESRAKRDTEEEEKKRAQGRPHRLGCGNGLFNGLALLLQQGWVLCAHYKVKQHNIRLHTAYKFVLQQ